MTKVLRVVAVFVSVAVSSLLCLSSATPSPPSTHSMHAGWNQWSCQPKERRRPVVLIHGFLGNGDKGGTWEYMGKQIVNKGFCVYSLTHGSNSFLGGAGSGIVKANLGGLDAIQNSAQEVAKFVDRVLFASGANKVNIIAHSAGTIVSRTYLKFLDGASKVDRIVLLAPVVHGTTLNGLFPTVKATKLEPVLDTLAQAAGFRSLFQMVSGAKFLKRLNADGESLPEVQYLLILSRFDGVVTPPENGLLKNSRGEIVTSTPTSQLSRMSSQPSREMGTEVGKASNVLNQWVQDWCPKDRSSHMELLSSPVVLAGIYRFFNPTARVDIVCPT